MAKITHLTVLQLACEIQKPALLYSKCVIELRQQQQLWLSVVISYGPGSAMSYPPVLGVCNRSTLHAKKAIASDLHADTLPAISPFHFSSLKRHSEQVEFERDSVNAELLTLTLKTMKTYTPMATAMAARAKMKLDMNIKTMHKMRPQPERNQW